MSKRRDNIFFLGPSRVLISIPPPVMYRNGGEHNIQNLIWCVTCFLGPYPYPSWVSNDNYAIFCER